MDKAYLFYSLSKFYIVKLSRRTYIVSVHIVVTIGTPVPSIITSGNEKVPTITITPISNGIPLEEQREEKGNVTPYEKSFAYIIEYKADFPYTTTGLSLSLFTPRSRLSIFMCGQLRTNAVPCTLVRISSFAAEPYAYTYFHGYCRIFSFQTSEPPCSMFFFLPLTPPTPAPIRRVQVRASA